MCESQKWIINVPTILLWYTEPPILGFDPKDLTILGLESLLKALTRLGLNLLTICSFIEPHIFLTNGEETLKNLSNDA